MKIVPKKRSVDPEQLNIGNLLKKAGIGKAEIRNGGT
jgi:hypothetical protein